MWVNLAAPCASRAVPERLRVGGRASVTPASASTGVGRPTVVRVGGGKRRRADGGKPRASFLKRSVVVTLSSAGLCSALVVPYCDRRRGEVPPPLCSLSLMGGV